MELLGEKWLTNLAESGDFHAFFRDILHAANLRHGTHGFTSPPKEGVLRGFFVLKNPTASAGFELANGQHATSRPPMPLMEVNPTDGRERGCKTESAFDSVFLQPRMTYMSTNGLSAANVCPCRSTYFQIIIDYTRPILYELLTVSVNNPQMER